MHLGMHLGMHFGVDLGVDLGVHRLGYYVAAIVWAAGAGASSGKRKRAAQRSGVQV